MSRLKKAEETVAWEWLLSLPRFDLSQRQPNTHSLEQVVIDLLPGDVTGCAAGRGGCPMIEIRISHPSKPGKRYKATGSSLFSACKELHTQLKEDGAETADVVFMFYKATRG